jgi:hypothetical protein
VLNASPKKYSVELLKNFSSRIVVDVPIVDRDCGFLLAEITITGISSEKTELETNTK